MGFSKALAVLCVALLATSMAGKVRYDGNRVVHVSWASEDQFKQLEESGLDIWGSSESFEKDEFGVALDVMVDDATSVILDKIGLEYTTRIPDVQANIDREEREIAQWNSQPRNLSAPDDWYTTYHTYAEIVTHLRDLANSYPNLVTFIASIGKSNEGRDIPAIIIDSKKSTVNRYFHLLGGQHAREWVGPATTLYVAEQLLVLSEGAAFLDRAAFYVVPMLNPDGYLFSWSSTRLWRKNRRANTGGTYGVDLNRNWDDGKWGQGGSSTTPSSDTYMGTAPFSEPESKAVAAWLTAQNKKFSGAIDYHSYSQLILRPAGWTNTPTANETVLVAAANGIQSAIASYADKKSYTSQRSYQLYQTTGTSTDYWYYKANVVFAYCIELRDTGTYGFQLPAAQILPTGKENWNGLKAFITYIFNNQ